MSRINLGTIKQASRPTVSFTWPLPAGHTPTDLTGFTVTGTMRLGSVVTAISGVLTVTDGLTRTISWALSVADSGTAGAFQLTFCATDGSDVIYTLFGRLYVEENPDVTAVPADPLTGLSVAERAFVTAALAANITPAHWVEVAGDTMSGPLQFSGSDHVGIVLISLTTAQRDALADPAVGALIWNSTEGEIQHYDGVGWQTIYRQSDYSAAPVADEPLKADGSGGIQLKESTIQAAGTSSGKLLNFLRSDDLLFGYFENQADLALVTAAGKGLRLQASTHIWHRTKTEIGDRIATPPTMLWVNEQGTVTGAIRDIVTIGHNCSNTPGSGFGAGIALQLESSTSQDQAAARLAAQWQVATHANRAADLVLLVSDYAAEREGLRIRANGAAPAIGFLGATPATQQPGGATAAGGTYTANEQAMLQAAYDCLRTFGLLS